MQTKLAAHAYKQDSPLQFCTRQARTRSIRIWPFLASPRLSQQLAGNLPAPDMLHCVKCVAVQSAAAKLPKVGSLETAAAGDPAQIPAIELSAEMAQAFKESFAALQHGVDWLADSAEFEQKARAIFDSTYDHVILQQLSEFTTRTDAPSAVLLTGLPVEDNLPPTIGDSPIPKVTQPVYQQSASAHFASICAAYRSS